MMIRAVAALLALPLAFAGCGSVDSEPVAPPTSAPSTSAPPPSTVAPAVSEPPTASTAVAAGPPTLTVRDSEYGETITDDRGQALYLFDADATSTSTCYEVCATAWPPLLTEGQPTVDGRLDEALLGTTTRADGSTQVTYNGHPLYYYRGDSPGVIRCQNVDIHGGLWLIVRPDGTPNASAAAA